MKCAPENVPSLRAAWLVLFGGSRVVGVKQHFKPGCAFLGNKKPSVTYRCISIAFLSDAFENSHQCTLYLDKYFVCMLIFKNFFLIFFYYFILFFKF